MRYADDIEITNKIKHGNEKVHILTFKYNPGNLKDKTHSFMVTTTQLALQLTTKTKI